MLGRIQSNQYCDQVVYQCMPCKGDTSRSETIVQTKQQQSTIENMILTTRQSKTLNHFMLMNLQVILLGRLPVWYHGHVLLWSNCHVFSVNVLLATLYYECLRK